MGKAEQDKAGQGRAGQVRTRQDRAGREGSVYPSNHVTMHTEVFRWTGIKHLQTNSQVD